MPISENQEPVDWSKVPLPPVRIGLVPSKTYYWVKNDYHPTWANVMLQVGQRDWDKKNKQWRIAIGPGVLDNLKRIFQGHCTVEEEVIETMQKAAEQNKAVEILKNSLASGADIPLPPEVKFNKPPPFDHQKKALALCLSRPSFGLFAEMGTGKTRVMVDLLAYLKTITPKAEWEPALVFCPLAVVENWTREVQKYQPTLRAKALLRGTSKGKITELHAARENGADLIVVNYETAWRMLDEFKKYYWSAIILDESTKIKNRASKQGKAAVKIGQWGRRRYILTGTPMPNSPLELFNQMKFLDTAIFGPSFYAFRDRYAIMGGYQHYQVVGWKNLPELSQKVALVSYSIKKKDCLDLPEKIYKEYRFLMTEVQAMAYRQMADDLVTEYEGKTIAVDVMLAKLTKLRQISSGFLYSDEGTPLRFTENHKLEKCLDLLDQLADDHKVVVWCLFKEEMDAIQKGIAEIGKKRLNECRTPFKAVRFDGSVPGPKRASLVDSFQEDPAVRVFIGQQHAGGLGITLTAADYCIFYSNDYSPEIRYQAEDRLHRIGQKKSVTYIDLLTKGTIDITIKSALARKKKLSDVVESVGLREVIDGEGLGNEDARFEL